MANLQDMASKLATASNWDAMSVSSSNAAISGTATTAAAVTAFSVEVSQMARAQMAGSAPLAPAGSPVGAGTLRIELGAWSTSGPTTFTKGSGAAVNVTVGAADTLSQIADKINAAGAGVTATVLKDDAGERLLMRSSATGEASAFRVQALAEPVAPATEYQWHGPGAAGLRPGQCNRRAGAHPVGLEHQGHHQWRGGVVAKQHD